MEKKISIMEIERFAIHDGPGIRTVVFMQGCPLRCSWCSNPESQIIKSRLLHMRNKCVGCGVCVKVCPHEVVKMNGRYPEFDRDSCIACKACAKACPHSAVRFVGEEVTAPAIMDIVMRDKEYYEASDGGITFSGGEAFVQFDGLMELLALSKKQGLHTVVETSGQIDPGRIRKAFPFIDLFLFDIKHVEQQLLKRETNADLSTVLANMQYIAHQNPDKIILRVPVVPGYNFDRETIRKVFDLAKENNIGRVHLLPYHILGKDKYEQLGVSYNYPYESMLPKEELLPLKETGEKMGLQVCIGG